jgi:hypothetical protein
MANLLQYKRHFAANMRQNRNKKCNKFSANMRQISSNACSKYPANMQQVCSNPAANVQTLRGKCAAKLAVSFQQRTRQKSQQCCSKFPTIIATKW